MSTSLSKEQIEDLIQYCGSSPTYWKNERMQICCPVHSESNPSCGVNSEIQGFHCFSCGAHGNFAKMLYYSRPEDFGYDGTGATSFRAEMKAREFLKERYELEYKTIGNRTRSVKRYDDLITTDTSEKKAEKNTLPLWKIAPFQSGKKTYNYFFERGFTVEDMKAFRIGYDGQNKTVTIPVFDTDSNLLGVIGRFIGPRKKNERYKIYYNFDRGSTLFPLDHFVPNDTVVLVEGQFDTIRLYHYGITNALSIMSDILTAKQVKLLQSMCSTVIYVGDNDERGLEAREKNRELLKGINFLTVDYPAHGKDVCDWSEKEIRGMLKSASSIKKIRRIE